MVFTRTEPGKRAGSRTISERDYGQNDAGTDSEREGAGEGIHRPTTNTNQDRRALKEIVTTRQSAITGFSEFEFHKSRAVSVVLGLAVKFQRAQNVAETDFDPVEDDGKTGF